MSRGSENKPPLPFEPHDWKKRSWFTQDEESRTARQRRKTHNFLVYTLPLVIAVWAIILGAIWLVFFR